MVVSVVVVVVSVVLEAIGVSTTGAGVSTIGAGAGVSAMTGAGAGVSMTVVSVVDGVSMVAADWVTVTSLVFFGTRLTFVFVPTTLLFPVPPEELLV